MGKHFCNSQETIEKRRMSLKKVVHTPEWNKKVSEAKKGKSTKAWTQYRKPKTREHWENQKAARKRNLEERKSLFYIIDGELYTASYLCKTTRIKGSTIKKTLAKYTPATPEEIEKWLSEHLADTIFELECMKDEVN